MVKIVGIMQVGGNYDWILPKSLKVLSELTDEVVLLGRGHVTELAKKTISELDNVAKFESWNGPDTCGSIDQLIKWSREAGADWILYQDADQIYEPGLKDRIQDLVTNNTDENGNTVGLYRFKHIWLWKDENHYRTEEKFMRPTNEAVLVKCTKKLAMKNRLGSYPRRIGRMLTKGTGINFWGAGDYVGIEGKEKYLESTVCLHYATLDWSSFLKKQIGYIVTISRFNPREAAEIISNRFEIVFNEREGKFAEVKEEWHWKDL